MPLVRHYPTVTAIWEKNSDKTKEKFKRERKIFSNLIDKYSILKFDFLEIGL